MTIRIYTAKHCKPCHEVERLIKEGKFSGGDEVELVDIETDEGFEKFRKEVLDFGDGAVPSAYKDGEKCLVRIDEENDNVLLECPTAPPSAQPD
jgi:glutaredoxin